MRRAQGFIDGFTTLMFGSWSKTNGILNLHRPSYMFKLYTPRVSRKERQRLPPVTFSFLSFFFLNSNNSLDIPTHTHTHTRTQPGFLTNNLLLRKMEERIRGDARRLSVTMIYSISREQVLVKQSWTTEARNDLCRRTVQFV